MSQSNYKGIHSGSSHIQVSCAGFYCTRLVIGPLNVLHVWFDMSLPIDFRIKFLYKAYALVQLAESVHCLDWGKLLYVSLQCNWPNKLSKKIIVPINPVKTIGHADIYCRKMINNSSY